jgi:hypothetical protein
MHLLTHPAPRLGQYSIAGSRADTFLATKVSSKWKEKAGFGSTYSVWQLVTSSLAAGCFVVTQYGRADIVVRLDTQVLLTASAAAATATAAAAARNEPLLAVIKQKWNHRGYNAVLRVLAEQLVQEADPQVDAAYTMRVSFARTRIRKFISSTWEKGAFYSGTGCPLEQLLASREDGRYFSISQVHEVGTEQCVSLDTQALLAEEDSGSCNVGSSSNTPGSTSSAAAAPAAADKAAAAAPAVAITAAPAAPNSSNRSSDSNNCSHCEWYGTTNTCAEPTVDGMPPVQYDGMLGVMAAAKAAAMAAYWQLQAQQQKQQPA